MIQWELTTLVASIATGERFSVIDPCAVWTVKEEDGKTAWDRLVAMADEGWELVSVTPISGVILGDISGGISGDISGNILRDISDISDISGSISGNILGNISVTGTIFLLYTFKRPKS